MIASTADPKGQAGAVRHLFARWPGASAFRHPLVRAVAGTLGLRMINVLLVYASTILLARLLGVQDFGRYAYALAWANLLAIPAALGHEGLLTRDMAVHEARREWALARGLLRWSSLLVATSAVLLALAAGLVFAWFTPAAIAGHAQVLWLAMASLPFLALARVRQAALQGLRHVVAGQLPELVVRPVGLCVLVLGIWLTVGRAPDATGAMVAQLIAGGIAFLVGTLLLWRRRPPELIAARPHYQPRLWLRTAWPMLCVGGMYVVNNQADAIMLGTMRGAEAVGVYTVGSRGAALLGFVLLAFNTGLAPTLARLHALRDQAAMQALVTRTCQLTTLLTSLAAILLLILAPLFLLVFGAEFLSARVTLTILCLGYLANALTGPVAQLLLMTGHERDTAWIVGGSAVLNVLLNAVLIPPFGPEGAAAATAASMAAWNIALPLVAWRQLGIVALPFVPTRPSPSLTSPPHDALDDASRRSS